MNGLVQLGIAGAQDRAPATQNDSDVSATGDASAFTVAYERSSASDSFADAQTPKNIEINTETRVKTDVFAVAEFVAAPELLPVDGQGTAQPDTALPSEHTELDPATFLDGLEINIHTPADTQVAELITLPTQGATQDLVISTDVSPTPAQSVPYTSTSTDTDTSADTLTLASQRVISLGLPGENTQTSSALTHSQIQIDTALQTQAQASADPLPLPQTQALAGAIISEPARVTGVNLQTQPVIPHQASAQVVNVLPTEAQPQNPQTSAAEPNAILQTVSLGTAPTSVTESGLETIKLQVPETRLSASVAPFGQDPLTAEIQATDPARLSTQLSQSATLESPLSPLGIATGGERTLASTPATFTASAPTLSPPPAVQTVGETLVKAIVNQSNITVQLDPPEMGRVHIEFQFVNEKSVTAIIRADAPETLTFLRDRAETLQLMLKDNGYDTVDMQFEAGQDLGQSHDQTAAEDVHYFTAESARTEDTSNGVQGGNATYTHAAIQDIVSGQAGLDLRL